MASRADIHAHLQAIGQLVEQLYEAPPSDGASPRQPSDINDAGSSARETENARLCDELDESRQEQERLRQQADVLATECDRLKQQLGEAEVAMYGLAKESEDFKSKAAMAAAECEQLIADVESLLSREETLEAEVAGLKMDMAGNELSINQLKTEKADLEAEIERQKGAVKRSLGLLLPGYVLEESGGVFKSVFAALETGRSQDMTAGDCRKLSALLFFGVLRSTIESVTGPLTFESGSQGKRILDTLRSLGEFIAQSVEDPQQAEKSLEFWAGKVIASNDILSDAFAIEVPFVGQAFNSAVMMPSDPDAFLSEVSVVHGWAILTPDRSSALAKALVE